MKHTLKTTHRGKIPVDTLLPNQTLIKKIGGRKTVDRIIDGLYDRIEKDSALRPMFVQNLAEEREKQKDFWEEWFGGAPQHTHHHAYNGLRGRHAHIHITKASAQQWLTYFTEALTDAVSDTKLVQEICAVTRPIALSFVNETSPPQSPKDLRCNRTRPFRTLKICAIKGQTKELLAHINTQPNLMDDKLGMAEVMQAASMKGRTATVLALIEAGVDPNHAAQFKEGCIFQSLMLTPLCVALLKKHTETAECLQAAGAKYDIFTAAYLGDLTTTKQIIKQDPSLANAEDPASDALQMTPLHHAVYGAHFNLVEFLFEHGAQVGKNSTPMVKYAANKGDYVLTKCLLEHGADATRIGPGIWALHPKLANMLTQAGADVNYPHGEWIWRTCTGNNSQRDNPDLLHALLNRGANIQAKLRGATALHYTAKAGFLKATNVLLEANANPNVENGDGETPIFYALKAGKRADIVAICNLLISKGANVKHKNKHHLTPLEIAEKLSRDDKNDILAIL
jgi:truncated hemoglobin YjbI/ankyrin repeat protein